MRYPELLIFVVIDCAFNRRHYAALIGRAFIKPPLLARVKIV